MRPKVRALCDRLYAGQIDGTTMFRSMIARYLTPNSIVLDIGAGHGKPGTDFKATTGCVVGVDPSCDIVRNACLTFKVKGSGESLPFRKEVFDLAFADFVLEHIDEPARCLGEICRVLRPEGYFVFRTPNCYHYAAAIGRATPYWFHRMVANRVRGQAPSLGEDIFPTRYRFNTRGRVAKIAEMAGFAVVSLTMVEREPSYLMFCRPALVLGFLYERLVNRFSTLAGCRSAIFGVLRKRSEGGATGATVLGAALAGSRFITEELVRRPSE